ncbi:MAG: sugar porter family MFS transporter [Gammaproteobacteria bacterium]|nr:sugar porter family MFS transporter [Gammaproteobacteria bacterium]
MKETTRYTVTVALIVALGGFLMGFDASVISGVVGFIEVEFSLTKIQLGWSVASLTLTATLAMLIAGPLSDRIGRRPVLKIAAALFAISAVASAVAPNFVFLVVARMIGGFGVGAALIIAPMYIAEIAPAAQRGRMVSFNQLNIVIGITIAFFSNYVILSLGQSDTAWVESLRFAQWNWRWMLGVETLPAVLYFLALLFVPESPRWLAMKGKDDDALKVLEKVSGRTQALADLAAVHESMSAEAENEGTSITQLFKPAMRLVLTIGISVAILQQITGINSVFFYAPMIFEQSGIGTDASFMQAVLVGVVNLVFTIVAMALIDRLGRRPLLGFGLAGIAVCMLTLSYAFSTANYTLSADSMDSLPTQIDRDLVAPLTDVAFDSDVAFRKALVAALGADTFKQHESQFVGAAIDMNPTLILLGILGFVASFAMSLGPVMWVLFSELFPNQLRGLAISFVGVINSAISFGVQLVFPWELENLGNAATFLIYGVCAIIGLVVVMRILPETKGRSLEELEEILVRS